MSAIGEQRTTAAHMREGGSPPLDRARSSKGKGRAMPGLCFSAKLERVVLLRGKIGLGCRQAGRVERNSDMLSRNSWNARPSSDYENGYNSDTQQDAHERSPLVAEEGPLLSIHISHSRPISMLRTSHKDCWPVRHFNRARECPLLAQSGHTELHCTCPLSGGMCCKTILTAKTSNIDSRTNANAQH
jgi:hypothetical protein